LEPPGRGEATQFTSALIASLDEPIGGETLGNLVKPGCRVAIAVDGSMNPHYAAQAVSALVKQLIELIVPSDRITVILGNCERENGGGRLHESLLKEPSLSQVKVLNHLRATAGTEEVGVTHGGTTIDVNRDYVEATLRIAVGETRVDPLYGFSGAHNAVVPGASSQRTLAESRRRYFKGNVAPGIIELNPLKEDAVEAARLAGIDFAVNIPVDPTGVYMGVYSGAFEETWGKAITALGGAYEVKADTLADITVVSAGGEQYDFNLYKASWALENAARATKRNGSVIMLAECRDGLGAEAFTRLSKVTEPSEFERRYTTGAEALQMVKRVTGSLRVILVSALPSYLIEPLGLESARTANQAYELAASGRRARSTFVIRHGCTVKVIV
ncbi:hypothetical protein A3K69_03210, partial [Candidatus Bathyarchaeota archaeon RBG_16_57_9]